MYRFENGRRFNLMRECNLTELFLDPLIKFIAFMRTFKLMLNGNFSNDKQNCETIDSRRRESH